jgi:lipopolysaccharide transport system permease protein
MGNFLRAIWNYRGFILSSIKREFQAKYRNSLLGALWSILNPLAMIVVYTVIFAEIMKAKLPGVSGTFAYSIYLCAGTLSWGLFSEIVGRAQNVFIENGNLLKKISFPRLCLPAVIIGSALINFGITYGLFVGFLLISGNFPGIYFIALLPLVLILILFSIGLGITLGVLNVFFRDVGQFFGIFLSFWFWMTPIVYPAEILSERIRPVLSLNPMASLIGAFQRVLVFGTWPDWSSLIPVAVLALLFCLFGLHLFRKHAGEMVDEL